MNKCKTLLTTNSSLSCCRKIASSARPCVAKKVELDFKNPATISKELETQWQAIPTSAYDTLSFSAGLRKSFKLQVQTLRECVFMLRKPTLEVMYSLSQTKPHNPTVRYLLYGKYGSGKTIALHHLCYWAHVNNWIVCLFPRAYIYRRNANESIQSTWKHSRIDLPEEASLWLSQFKKANEAQLKNPELVTSKTYNWAPGETTQAGRPLLELITMGTTRIKTASDCMAALLKELKNHAKSKKVKVLIAVDQVNALFGPTLLRRLDNYYAEPDDVTIMRAIRDMLTFDWNNGAVVGVLDAFEKQEHLPSSPATAHLPYYLLGRDGMNFLEPYLPVEIPAYSEQEASSCIDYYIDKNWLISSEARTEEGRREMFRLACFNPLLLEQLAAQY